MQNLCTNPSFETNAGGFWSGSASQSADYAKDGTKSAKVTSVFTAGSITSGHNYLNINGSAPFTPVLGRLLVFSAWIYVPIGSPITRINTMAIRRFDNYSTLANAINKNVVPGEWVKQTAKLLVSIQTDLRFTVADPVAAGFTGTASYYIDGVRIEYAPSVPTFSQDTPY